MKAFVLLVFIPSFITADILCPKSKTTCPEDKKCCEVDGEYSCCDSDVDIEEPAQVFANLSYPANESKQMMNCQRSQKQCGDHCCGWTDICCGKGCCGVTDNCCDDHCCGLTETCCGAGCCPWMKKCCGNRCCD
ncbi:unnamed protein product [Larinioides sclopetarius]|uniref:Uncharacterized protein n=1 Tax=Larinioides sclopetarius TaxID=280406 RepID=A0AAV2B2G3_9ARAC